MTQPRTTIQSRAKSASTNTAPRDGVSLQSASSLARTEEPVDLPAHPPTTPANTNPKKSTDLSPRAARLPICVYRRPNELFTPPIPAPDGFVFSKRHRRRTQIPKNRQICHRAPPSHLRLSGSSAAKRIIYPAVPASDGFVFSNCHPRRTKIPKNQQICHHPRPGWVRFFTQPPPPLPLFVFIRGPLPGLL
jgi:hypothetical protein